MLAAGAGGSCMDHSVSEKETVGLERQQGASSCLELGGGGRSGQGGMRLEI